MNTPPRRLLYWAPRALSVLYALFISLFALDVFGTGGGFWPTLIAFLIHLLPTAIIIAVLAVAWRWEWVGALVFAGLAAFYLLDTRGHLSWSAGLTIAGPLFLIALLFLANWMSPRQRA